MRFLAWLILGWILKEASMAEAACLFQKDGSSSATGTGQHPQSQLTSPCIPGAPTALGHPQPWGTHSLGIPSSNMAHVRVLFGVGGHHVDLHSLPGPGVLGQGRRRDSKKGHDGELSGKWHGAEPMVGGGWRLQALPPNSLSTEARRNLSTQGKAG